VIISSQPEFHEPPALAVAAANAATLGIVAALQRWAVSEAEADQRKHLEDMRLPEPLRALLHSELNKSVNGSVEHDRVRSEIGAAVQIQYTVVRTQSMELVLLDVPESILSNGKQTRRLLELTYLLRDKTVRVFSHDLSGIPCSALNGVKTLWEEDNIDLEYVPLAHIGELERGEAELKNVLKLKSHALQDSAEAPPVDSSPSSAQPVTGIPKRLKIFLASSEELRADRDQFVLYFRERNDHFIDRGMYLEVVRWENFLDAMSETRLQDEYNQAVRESDIFVCLFFTKTGTFTEEEFDTAYAQFKKTGKPSIFTFFKNAEITIGDVTPQALNSLFKFKEKLKDLEHYRTEYNNIEHLQLQFDRQLEKLLGR